MRRHCPPFVALDFETADHLANSACAVGVVRVEGGQITGRAARLIRPPRPRVWYTHVHGITWADVRHEPPFAAVWADLAPLIDGAAFLAAHNAPFDRRVLDGCLETAGLTRPPTPFVCTVRLARKAWNVRPANLAAVCRHLAVPLDHHHAGSDAHACAQILLSALDTSLAAWQALPAGVVTALHEDARDHFRLPADADLAALLAPPKRRRTPRPRAA